MFFTLLPSCNVRIAPNLYCKRHSGWKMGAEIEHFNVRITPNLYCKQHFDKWEPKWHVVMSESHQICIVSGTLQNGERKLRVLDAKPMGDVPLMAHEMALQNDCVYYEMHLRTQRLVSCLETLMPGRKCFHCMSNSLLIRWGYDAE